MVASVGIRFGRRLESDPNSIEFCLTRPQFVRWVEESQRKYFDDIVFGDFSQSYPQRVFVTNPSRSVIAK
jgi:hypothetical protein